MLTGKDFVAGLNDQLVMLIVKPLAGMVGCGSGFLQDRIGGDHLARNQIFADAEMFERALGLSTPELVRRNLDFAETISLFANVCVLYTTCRVHRFLLSAPNDTAMRVRTRLIPVSAAPDAENRPRLLTWNRENREGNLDGWE